MSLDSIPSPAVDSNADVKLCPLFCDVNADVTFQSSDGVLFKIYSKHLASTSAGFSVPEMTSVGKEPVVLQEPAAVLEVLFQFVHPSTEAMQYRQPSVIDMEANLFFNVAEAAEKYLVGSTMNTCYMRMHYEMYMLNPISVLNHCAKHGYDYLADAVAPLTVEKSIPDIIAGLTFPGLALRWMKYYNHWLQTEKLAMSLYESHKASDGQNCEKIQLVLLDFLQSSLTSRSSHGLNYFAAKRECTSWCECSSKLSDWDSEINEKIREIPKFSEINL